MMQFSQIVNVSDFVNWCDYLVPWPLRSVVSD